MQDQVENYRVMAGWKSPELSMYLLISLHLFSGDRAKMSSTTD